MKPELVSRLIEINSTFYDQFATSFAETRNRPQPGFEKLLTFFPQPCRRFLDVGCGEGRLGRYLLSRKAINEYVGVDFTPALLAIANNTVSGTFYARDLTTPNPFEGLGRYQAIACLATMQHLPGRENRLNLLIKMASLLDGAGSIIILSNWQFLKSARQRRKMIDWQEVGIRQEDLEPTDYLISWQRNGFGLRYVNYIDESETVKLVKDAGLTIRESFESDGKEGNLNLYTIIGL